MSNNKSSARNVRREKFTMISNDVLHNQEITTQAKGLLAILVSNREDWVINMKEIIQRSKNGRDAHYKQINELIKFGYVARIEVKNKSNQFVKIEYIASDDVNDVLEEIEIIKEEQTEEGNVAYIEHMDKKETSKRGRSTDFSPYTENQYMEHDEPFTENPYTENPYTGKPDTENQYINNTKGNNTKSNNTKSNNTNLSINEIEESELPVSVQRVVKNKIDRLIHFSIDLNTIVSHFQNVQDVYTENEYQGVLSDLLDKFKNEIHDFGSVMNNWLERNRKKKSQIAQSPEKKQSVAEKPKILDDAVEEVSATSENQNDMNVEEAKRKIEKLMSSAMDKKQ